VPLRRQQRGKREKGKRDRESKRSGAHFEIKGKREMKETHTAETDNTASSGQENVAAGLTDRQTYRRASRQ
jgi:hypothetical protein